MRHPLALAVTVALLGAGCASGGTETIAAPDATAEERAPDAVTAADLNGIYRYEITLAEARSADMVDREDPYPHVNTWTLRDGRYSNPGGLAGTYTVEGDRITFDVPAFGYALTFTFSVDEVGNLHLTPVPPMDPGDAFVWSHDLWKKIE